MEIPLIKDHDFIIFGLQPWDIPIGSNCKNIAEEISKSNKVLYVNRPLDRISRIKYRNDVRVKNRVNSIKHATNILVEICNNLWIFNPVVILESVNFLPRGVVYNYFNKRNNKKLANEIMSASLTLGMKNPILIVDNDFFNGLYLKEFLKPGLMVYYIRDYLLSQEYFKRHGNRAEPIIIQKADVVVANSKYLTTYASRYNANSFDIGQGCEVDDFLNDKQEIPDELKNIKHPIIGYCGALYSNRLDIDLIYFMAVQKPEWTILLVGPEDENFKLSKLHNLSNIRFLGSKPANLLPGYIHTFDVCINPQLLNEMTIGNYPRKVDEYLAAGKPVVAIRTEAMEIFGENVYLSNTKEGFLEKIHEALEESQMRSKKDARQALAKSHTWYASVKKLYAAIIKTNNNYG